MSYSRRPTMAGLYRRTSSFFGKSDINSEDEDEGLSGGRKMSRRGSIFFGSDEDPPKGPTGTHWPSVLTVQLAKNMPQSRWKKFRSFFDNVTCPCFDKKTTRSLFILGESNVIRRFCTYVIHHVIFEYFILCAIVANCLVLALDEYLPDGDRTQLSLNLEQTDPYFLIIFTTEAVLKIISCGLILHKGAYLRSPWNILDFVIVMAGLLSKLFDFFNQPALRALRVLRPVKIVTGFESLQVVLKSIIMAMAPLLQIGFLVLFAVIIFAIIGLEFYCGVLHRSCWNINEKIFDYQENDLPVPCSMPTNSTSPIGLGFQCPSHYICMDGWEGPNYGMTSFDNIYLSILTVFVILTMASWSSVMYCLNDAIGKVFNWIYFLPIIIFGSLFMVNLVLGVLSCEFANERQRVESRKEFLRLKRQKAMDAIIENYLDWIYKAEEMILSEELTTDEEKLRILDARRTSTFVRIRGLDSRKIMSEEKERQIRERLHTGFCRKIWRKQSQLRYAIRKALKSPIFFWGVIVLVFLNTALVACEHHNEPLWLELLLVYSEYVFLSLFLLEMVLKMYGLGLRKYFSSSFNFFDFIVLMASVAEVIVQTFDNTLSFGFSSLRATRLLRIFKVTRYWQSLRNLVISLVNSIKSIISLLFILFLFMVIFSLLGMQFFGGKMNFIDGRPKANFDNFASSMLTVFQILTGEEWDKVMYNGMMSVGGFNFWGVLASLYFLALVILGSYTLLNVFLAIAVDNLAKANELTHIELQQEMRRKSMVPPTGLQENEEPTIEIVGPGSDPQVQSSGEINRGYVSESSLETQVTSSSPGHETPGSPTQQNGVPPMAAHEYHYQDEGNKHVPILSYSSLFIFSSTNPVRKFCHFFVNLRWFNWFIIVIILASCAELAMEDPVTFDSYYNFILSQFDYSFTAVFLAEVVIKVIDLGFILHKGSYCRDLWNVLDLFIVVCAIAGIAFAGSNTNLDTVKSLRVLRVLRPLKTINRIPKLKAVFDGLVTAVKKVMLIMSLYLLFQIIFAIIAVQLFMGRFYYCTDLSMRTEDKCKGEYIDYVGNSFETMNREWSRFDFHFDNIGASLLTLFVVQTRSGWPDILKNAMDSSQRDQGPILEYNNNMAVFFFVYFLVFPFFFVNLFVALIVVTFQEQGEKELEELNLDKNQRNCLEFVVNSDPVDCYMPSVKNRIRLRIWKIIISKPFDYLMFILISLNTITLMMKFYNQPQWYDNLLSYANIFFTVAFTIEAITKIFGYGIKNYFRQAWNVFDFITVIGSIVDVIVYYTVEGSMKTLGFLKLFRAMRLMKLLKQSGSIRMLLWTFFQAVKALPYVLIIIGLLFFVYAVIGMQLFGTIGLDNSSSINRQANFQNFPNALLLLFRCSTLDNWDGVLVSCLSGQTCDPRSFAPGTDPQPTCGTEAAIVYFVSFNFITAFMMLNLFIAVIMDNFDYLTRDSSILGPHHLDSYIQKWGVYDPTASSYISYTEAYELLRELEPPVGFGKKCPWKLAYRKMIRMNMPINEYGKVHFKTTMFALIREALSIKVTKAEMMDQMDWELRNIMSNLFFLDSKELDVLLPPREELMGGKLTVGKVYASLLLIDSWKQYKLTLNPEPDKTNKKDDSEEPRSPKLIRKLFKSVSGLWTRRISRIGGEVEEKSRRKSSRGSASSQQTSIEEGEDDYDIDDYDDNYEEDDEDDDDEEAVERKRKAFVSLSENTVARRNYDKYLQVESGSSFREHGMVEEARVKGQPANYEDDYDRSNNNNYRKYYSRPQALTRYRSDEDSVNYDDDDRYRRSYQWRPKKPRKTTTDEFVINIENRNKNNNGNNDYDRYNNTNQADNLRSLRTLSKISTSRNHEPETRRSDLRRHVTSKGQEVNKVYRRSAKQEAQMQHTNCPIRDRNTSPSTSLQTRSLSKSTNGLARPKV